MKHTKYLQLRCILLVVATVFTSWELELERTIFAKIAPVLIWEELSTDYIKISLLPSSLLLSESYFQTENKQKRIPFILPRIHHCFLEYKYSAHICLPQGTDSWNGYLMLEEQLGVPLVFNISSTDLLNYIKMEANAIAVHFLEFFLNRCC